MYRHLGPLLRARAIAWRTQADRTRALPVCLAIAVLAACTAGQQDDVPVDDSVPVTAPDDSWTLAADGFGPLTVGMSAMDAAAATEGTLVVPPTTDAEPCVHAVWPEAPGGVRVMFEHGTLARVELYESGVATTDGIQVGDAAARLDSLYGGSSRTLPHKYTEGTYVIVLPLAPGDTTLRMVFETDGPTVTAIRGGRFPQVEYVEGCA